MTIRTTAIDHFCLTALRVLACSHPEHRALDGGRRWCPVDADTAAAVNAIEGHGDHLVPRLVVGQAQPGAPVGAGATKLRDRIPVRRPQEPCVIGDRERPGGCVAVLRCAQARPVLGRRS